MSFFTHTKKLHTKNNDMRFFTHTEILALELGFINNENNENNELDIILEYYDYLCIVFAYE